MENIEKGPGGFYTADVYALNSVGTEKKKTQRSTFFPDNWNQAKVMAVISEALLATKGKGGSIHVRDLANTKINAPGIYIKLKVQNGKLIQAFPEKR